MQNYIQSNNGFYAPGSHYTGNDITSLAETNPLVEDLDLGTVEAPNSVDSFGVAQRLNYSFNDPSGSIEITDLGTLS